MLGSSCAHRAFKSPWLMHMKQNCQLLPRSVFSALTQLQGYKGWDIIHFNLPLLLQNVGMLLLSMWTYLYHLKGWYIVIHLACCNLPSWSHRVWWCLDAGDEPLSLLLGADLPVHNPLWFSLYLSLWLPSESRRKIIMLTIVFPQIRITFKYHSSQPASQPNRHTNRKTDAES